MKTVDESLQFISKYLPVAESYTVKSIDQIKPEFPLVLKIVSSKFIHKTEVKGIRIVNNQEGLVKNFNELKKIKGTKAILVQEFVKGTELIIGIKKDSSFGHAIMFGIGGVMVELLKDVSFRICPINDKDAESMINELKSKELLTGFRGQAPVNLKLLKKILVKASNIPVKNKNITELDINPLIINERQALAVDARLELD
ncbi:acetate--CoA ligase family protein [Candidatus Woesearchaeota archaeon]|nr:acetate--CoA ligase family protein [Candidatus Woesearchaeota archaeon]